jgi:hypothetical protein
MRSVSYALEQFGQKKSFQAYKKTKLHAMRD